MQRSHFVPCGTFQAHSCPIPVTFDHALVKRAARRSGSQRFHLDTTAIPRRSRYTSNAYKLNWDTVKTMRAWALDEGWGLTRKRQAEILAKRFGAAVPTVIDVLRNDTWWDGSYVPGQLKPSSTWSALPLPVVLLKLMAREQP